MAMNPMALLKMKKAWDTFSGNHPRFPAFLQAVQNTGIREGTIIEVTITTPEGKSMTTNQGLLLSLSPLRLKLCIYRNKFRYSV